MNVQMPVMNGFEASQRIKELSPSTLIIALSGESGPSELAQISSLMDDHLQKPTDLNALRETLTKWLGQVNCPPPS